MQLVLHGRTRVVILTNYWAIKIARINVSWMVKRFFIALKDGDLAERLDTYHKNRVRAVLRVALQGIIANRREAREWKRVQKLAPCVPTKNSYLGGVVIIQERGAEVTREQLREEHPFLHLLGDASLNLILDLTNHRNFCRLDGRVCLLDYGSDDTARLFGIS